MTASEADALLSALARTIAIAPGLSDDELHEAERTFSIRFPPDLRLFLSRGLPAGDRFPDWRARDATIDERLRWPEEGILFDVDQGLWPAALGQKPADAAQARAQASAAVRAAPRLIPVFSHRYLPAEPLRAGNPVFSVYQSDIIRYGDDLTSYLQHEFGFRLPREPDPDSGRRIRFWDDIVDEG